MIYIITTSYILWAIFVLQRLTAPGARQGSLQRTGLVIRSGSLIRENHKNTFKHASHRRLRPLFPSSLVSDTKSVLVKNPLPLSTLPQNNQLERSTSAQATAQRAHSCALVAGRDSLCALLARSSAKRLEVTTMDSNRLVMHLVLKHCPNCGAETKAPTTLSMFFHDKFSGAFCFHPSNVKISQGQGCLARFSCVLCRHKPFTPERPTTFTIWGGAEQ